MLPSPIHHMVFVITWLLILSSLSFCSGSNSNVQCLKDLKQSVGGPNGALSSWNFSCTGMEGYSLSQFAGITGWPGDDNGVMLLNLSSLGLQGSFPRGLQLCARLASLDLRNNSLSGPIPADISLHMPYVKYLDLSHNNFSGEIPQDISRWLMFIVTLDLSNNSLSGEIPRTISDLLFLNTLNLQCNLLTGDIPEQIGYLGQLQSINLSENSLSGPIPGSLQRFAAQDFAGNKGLCGVPLDCNCKERHRLRRVNDASSIGVAVGFVVGFVVAFYFPHWFVFCGDLRPYVIRPFVFDK